MRLQGRGYLTPLDPDTPAVRMAELETTCHEFHFAFLHAYTPRESSFRIPAGVLKRRRPRGYECHLSDPAC